MTHFNAHQGLIIVRTMLIGPTGDTVARLALDTGASATVVSVELLELIGYDPNALPKTVRFTTGSRVESAPRLLLGRIEALDRVMAGFPVVAHTLPATASVDGVLGLDFLRGSVLTINFINGEISLD